VSDAEMLVECVGAGRHYANELARSRARDRAAAHGSARRRAIALPHMGRRGGERSISLVAARNCRAALPIAAALAP
jgi:hypothetical protein